MVCSSATWGKAAAAASNSTSLLSRSAAEKVVEAKHPREAQLRRLRKRLRLDPGSPLGGEDAPLGSQSVHLQQAIHAVLRLGPQPREAATRPRQQPQGPEGRGRKPSLRERLHVVHGQFLHQAPCVQPLRLLLE